MASMKHNASIYSGLKCNKQLILMVGLPRSGKTTKALSVQQEYRKAGRNVEIVYPDNLRLALFVRKSSWYITEVCVKAGFIISDIVIVDSTHATRADRLTWMCPSIAYSWKRYYLFMDVHKDVCIERAIQDGRQDLIPVIEKMSAMFEPPVDLAEGFPSLAL